MLGLQRGMLGVQPCQLGKHPRHLRPQVGDLRLQRPDVRSRIGGELVTVEETQFHGTSLPDPLSPVNQHDQACYHYPVNGYAVAYLVLTSWSRSCRAVLDLGDDKIISADDSIIRAPTLRSEQLGLIGRCDHLVKVNAACVPVEQKPTARRLQQSHILQVGALCLLIQDIYGVRLPYGIVVLAGGRRELLRILSMWFLNQPSGWRAQVRGEFPRPSESRPASTSIRSLQSGPTE